MNFEYSSAFKALITRQQGRSLITLSSIAMHPVVISIILVL